MSKDMEKLFEDFLNNVDETEVDNVLPKNSMIEEVIKYHYDYDMLLDLNAEYFIKWAQKGLFSDSKNRLKKLLVNRPTKSFLVETLSIFFTNREFFLKAFSEMEPIVRDAFWRCSWYGKADIGELYKEYKVNIKTIQKTGDGRFLESKFRFFKTQPKFRGMQKGELFFEPVLARELKKFLPKPEEAKLKTINETNTKYVGNYENEILENIHLLWEMKENGDIKLGGNNKVTKTLFSFLDKNSNIKDLYESSIFEDADKIKKELIVKILYSINTKYVDFYDKPEDMIKEVVTKILSTEAFIEKKYGNDALYSINLSKTILKHLKFRYLDDEMLKEYMFDLKNTLIEMSSNGWVDVENIVIAHILREITPFPYDRRDAEVLLESNNVYLDFRRESMDESIFINILVPFTKGIMLLLATLGVVELAYDDLSKNNRIRLPTYYDGIKYVKITELGKYILGVNKEYTSNVNAKSKLELTLSENDLIITAIGEERIKNLVLSRIAEKVSENIYRVNFNTIFQGCTSSDDVVRKIDKFTKSVDKVPEKWRLFFEKIKNSFSPLKPVQDFKVLKITEDRELIEFIAKDSELKKLILKAENYHILVEEKNLAKVKKILAGYGYF